MATQLPQDFITGHRGGYRIPRQNPSGAGVPGFATNRQIQTPRESNIHLGGQGPLRSSRGGAITAGFSGWDTDVVGSYYFPQWGNGVSVFSMLVGDIGRTIVAPFFCTEGDTFDRIRGYQGIASTSSHHMYIYVLDPDTWLPTELLLDAGAMGWAGAGGDNTNTIALTASSNLLGLGWRYVSRSDAFNPAVYTKAVSQCDPWPPGWDEATTPMPQMEPFRIESTGDPTDVSTFAINAVGVANPLLKCQPLLGLRRS